MGQEIVQTDSDAPGMFMDSKHTNTRFAAAMLCICVSHWKVRGEAGQ